MSNLLQPACLPNSTFYQDIGYVNGNNETYAYAAGWGKINTGEYNTSKGLFCKNLSPVAFLRMYCIDKPGVPESHDACAFHCLYN